MSMKRMALLIEEKEGYVGIENSLGTNPSTHFPSGRANKQLK